MTFNSETYTLLVYPSREMLIARVIEDDKFEHPAWLTYEVTTQSVRLNFTPVTLFSESPTIDGKQARASAIFEFVPEPQLVKSYSQLIAQLRAARAGLVDVASSLNNPMAPSSGNGSGGIIMPSVSIRGMRS